MERYHLQSNVSPSARCLFGRWEESGSSGMLSQGILQMQSAGPELLTYAESKVKSESSDSTSGRSQEQRTLVHQQSDLI